MSKHKKPIKNRCHQCQERYYRVNKLWVWAVHNPGHVQGWRKQEVKLCTRCMDARHAQRILTVAQVRIIPGPRERQQAARVKH